MNKTEADYERTFLMDKPHGFEQVKLRLADSTFLTLDFWVLADDDVLEFHEVKGHWEDDARVKIKVAAEQYPHFRFKAFSRVKGQWRVELIGPADAVAG